MRAATGARCFVLLPEMMAERFRRETILTDCFRSGRYRGLRLGEVARPEGFELPAFWFVAVGRNLRELTGFALADSFALFPLLDCRDLCCHLISLAVQNAVRLTWLLFSQTKKRVPILKAQAADAVPEI